MDIRYINGAISLDVIQRLREAMKTPEIEEKILKKNKNTAEREEMIEMIADLYRQASNDSPLLDGEREKEIFGTAWSRFLQSRPENVEALFNHLTSPEMMKRMEKLPNIRVLNRKFGSNPNGMAGYLLSHGLLGLGEEFKTIMESVGFVKYKEGETLGSIINRLRAEIRGGPNPAPKEDPLEPMSGLPATPVFAARSTSLGRA